MKFRAKNTGKLKNFCSQQFLKPFFGQLKIVRLSRAAKVWI
jgi:hypothetical protein